MWLCECNCDNKTRTVVRNSSLIKEKGIRSCGCLKIEKAKEQKKFNTYIEKENYIIGYTENNKCFYFDKDDYDLIKKYYWNRSSAEYIVAWIDGKKVQMHRFIMQIKISEQIDHINGIRYDNRKSNLRKATKLENARNEKIAKNNTSGKTGVYWEKTSGKWRAYIGLNYKNLKLGDFDSYEDAVQTRINAEIKYYKEFRYMGAKDDY
jgi:hypothetical protein